jgi:hypothetical protein
LTAVIIAAIIVAIGASHSAISVSVPSLPVLQAASVHAVFHGVQRMA